MTEDLLLEKTAAALPGFTPEGLSPIEKGGSSRFFYRVFSRNGIAPRRSAILVRDLGEKEENRHYAALAGFLSSHGVPVPKVLATSDGEGLLWLEDLGEQDLWATRNESWEVRRPLYESVLRGIVLLHRIPCGDADVEGLHLQLAFDERLYRWEQEYFVSHCLGDLFGTSREKREEFLDSPQMKSLARGLASLPRQLVHRDFQSQNILIRSGDAAFIDFQGMRPGLAQYDLASLLCDPYVEIAAGERDHLLGYYKRILSGAGINVGWEFDRVFWQCAAQRLMQALGAYGFLSIHRGKPAFRAHVAPALIRLREALANLHPDDRIEEVEEGLKNLKHSQGSVTDAKQRPG
jgi:aminoglycoside/choline kinase family phosphotransferase